MIKVRQVLFLLISMFFLAGESQAHDRNLLQESLNLQQPTSSPQDINPFAAYLAELPSNENSQKNPISPIVEKEEKEEEEAKGEKTFNAKKSVEKNIFAKIISQNVRPDFNPIQHFCGSHQYYIVSAACYNYALACKKHIMFRVFII